MSREGFDAQASASAHTPPFWQRSEVAGLRTSVHCQKKPPIHSAGCIALAASLGVLPQQPGARFAAAVGKERLASLLVVQRQHGGALSPRRVLG